MVALFRSYLTPLVVLSAVPIGVIGVILMLYFTGTALNVQSLLGVIFMIGIVVSNTVLLIDFAENVRRRDRLVPLEAIRRAAAVRVRPVVMTALATFFALIPMSLGLSRGSEANVPLGRAVLGGLVAGLVDDAVRGPVRLLAGGAQQVRDGAALECHALSPRIVGFRTTTVSPWLYVVIGAAVESTFMRRCKCSAKPIACWFRGGS